jgi:hypothetical protein
MGGRHGLTSEYDSSSYRPRMDDYNGWADFWRYDIGVNVIPAKTIIKETYINWKQHQDMPIAEAT